MVKPRSCDEPNCLVNIGAISDTGKAIKPKRQQGASVKIVSDGGHRMTQERNQYKFKVIFKL